MWYDTKHGFGDSWCLQVNDIPSRKYPFQFPPELPDDFGEVSWASHREGQFIHIKQTIQAGHTWHVRQNSLANKHTRLHCSKIKVGICLGFGIIVLHSAAAFPSSVLYTEHLQQSWRVRALLFVTNKDLWHHYFAIPSLRKRITHQYDFIKSGEGFCQLMTYIETVTDRLFTPCIAWFAVVDFVRCLGWATPLSRKNARNSACWDLHGRIQLVKLKDVTVRRPICFEDIKWKHLINLNIPEKRKISTATSLILTKPGFP